MVGPKFGEGSYLRRVIGRAWSQTRAFANWLGIPGAVSTFIPGALLHYYLSGYDLTAVKSKLYEFIVFCLVSGAGLIALHFAYAVLTAPCKLDSELQRELVKLRAQSGSQNSKDAILNQLAELLKEGYALIAQKVETSSDFSIWAPKYDDWYERSASYIESNLGVSQRVIFDHFDVSQQVQVNGKEVSMEHVQKRASLVARVDKLKVMVSRLNEAGEKY